MRRIAVALGLLAIAAGIVWYVIHSHSKEKKQHVAIIVLKPAQYAYDTSSTNSTWSVCERHIKDIFSKEKPELDLTLIAPLLFDEERRESITPRRGLGHGIEWNDQLSSKLDSMRITINKHRPKSGDAFKETIDKLVYRTLKRDSTKSRILVVGILDPCLTDSEIDSVVETSITSQMKNFDSAEVSRFPKVDVRLILSGRLEAVESLRKILNQRLGKFATIESERPPVTLRCEPGVAAMQQTTVEYSTLPLQIGVFLFSPLSATKAACNVTRMYSEIPGDAWKRGVEFHIFKNAGYKTLRVTSADSARIRDTLLALLTHGNAVTDIRRFRFIMKKVDDLPTETMLTKLFILGTISDRILQQPPQQETSSQNEKPEWAPKWERLQNQRHWYAYIDVSPDRAARAFANLFTYYPLQFTMMQCPN